MAHAIGADAARLAGLQIDLLSKFRHGQVTLAQFEWWLQRTKAERDLLMAGAELVAQGATRVSPAIPADPAVKFVLLADLGEIVVPAGYDHATRLGVFAERNRNQFYGYHNAITDANFPNPTRVLKPGDRLSLRVFKQVVDTTTSEERLAFLATQNAALVGAQGASLAWEQKCAELPKGYWHPSMHAKERLFEDADGLHRVPRVGASSGGHFYFDLGFFEGEWGEVNTLLCFCDA